VVAAKQVFRILKGERSAAMNRIANFLSRLPADKDFKVEISELKARRSEAQNAYLWGGVYPAIMAHLEGWDADDVHEYFLGEHFGWETLSGFGKKRLRPLRRSSGLNKTEFATFIDFIQRRAAELGIVIPEALNAREGEG
jgi:hypothetical protein